MKEKIEVRIYKWALKKKLLLKAIIKDMIYHGEKKEIELKNDKEMAHIIYDHASLAVTRLFEGEKKDLISKTFNGYLSYLDKADSFKELEEAMNRLDHCLLHMKIYETKEVKSHESN